MKAPPKGVEPIEGEPQPGVWYRCGMYHDGNKSHKISRESPDIFWCGRIVWPTPEQADFLDQPWWLAEDTRKSGHCGDCAAREKKWLEAQSYRNLRRDIAESKHLYDMEVSMDGLMRIARTLEQEAL